MLDAVALQGTGLRKLSPCSCLRLRISSDVLMRLTALQFSCTEAPSCQGPRGGVFSEGGSEGALEGSGKGVRLVFFRAHARQDPPLPCFFSKNCHARTQGSQYNRRQHRTARALHHYPRAASLHAGENQENCLWRRAQTRTQTQKNPPRQRQALQSQPQPQAPLRPRPLNTLHTLPSAGFWRGAGLSSRHSGLGV